MLAAVPKRIAKLVEAASPRALKRAPAPGKWSAGEILAHLADTEVVIGYRCRAIAGSPGCAIAGFDQEQWAAGMDYAGRRPRASLAAYLAVRQVNLELLKSLTPAHWRNYGIHAERGVETLETVARMTAGHDLNHLRQIEDLLA